MAKNRSFLLGAIVGGMAGAAAALFLSSERGKQWLDEMKRTDIKNMQEAVKQKVASLFENENDEEEAATSPSISIPLPPSDDVEQLLKETEQAVADAERLFEQRGDERAQA
jgi:gas vesicle protein